MRFQTPLVPARLIRRYKRFLADAVLEETGEIITAHCPNPGAMTGLQDADTRIWLEPNNDPRKKLRFGWRVSELPEGGFACIDTTLPNRVAKEALLAGQVEGLSQYGTVQPEISYGTGSRIDFLLSQETLPAAYVEVKSVTLRRAGHWAEFPDCVTKRGAKHLQDLTEISQMGGRAIMLYLVGRADCSKLKIAANIDPIYAQNFDLARESGVEMLCYASRISPEGIWLDQPLRVDSAAQFPPRLV